MVIGIYVGLATVGVFGVWYTCDSFLGIDLSGDGHSVVSMSQLMSWQSCSAPSRDASVWAGFAPKPFTTVGGQTFSFSSDPCSYFTTGKIKASTLSLSVLVTIEMFNALNALSEDNSLLVMPPWINPVLILAMVVSFGLHFLILYVPFLAEIFAIVPLSFEEWMLVIAFSFPVIIIDELLKVAGRQMNAAEDKMRASAGETSGAEVAAEEKDKDK